MNSFKKLLSVLVVLAMLASFVPASIAAVPFVYEDQANILYNLGLFKGISTDSFVPDLGGSVTREQGVVLLLRTLSKEDDAMLLSDSEASDIIKKFTDADQIPDWAKKHIAWAVKNGIVAGYPSGAFGPKDPLSGKAYAKLLLSTIGYTVDAAAYSNACYMMKDKGTIAWGTRGTVLYALSADEALKFNAKETLKRDDLVGMSYGGLKMIDPNGKTPISILVNEGIVNKDKAIAGYLFFKELKDESEAKVKAYEDASLNSLNEITAAEALEAPAQAAIDQYLKGNVTGLASITDFDKKFNLNKAYIKADYDGFNTRMAAKKTAISKAKEAASVDSVQLVAPTETLRVMPGTKDVKVTYSLLDANGVQAAAIDNKVLTLESSDATIAELVKDANGKDLYIDLKAAGTVTLTAKVTATGKSSSITITVNAAGVVDSVELVAPTGELKVKEGSKDVKLEYSMYYEDGSKVAVNDNKLLTLESSDAAIAELVKDANGIDLYIDLKDAGTVTLTATVNGNSSSITIDVVKQAYANDVNIEYFNFNGVSRNLSFLASINTLQFVVKDREGKIIQIPEGYKIVLTSSGAVSLPDGTGDPKVLEVNQTVNGYTKGIKVLAGAEKGEGTITAQLVNGDQNVGEPVNVAFSVDEKYFDYALVYPLNATTYAYAPFAYTKDSGPGFIIYMCIYDQTRSKGFENAMTVNWTITNDSNKNIQANGKTIAPGETDTTVITKESSVLWQSKIDSITTMTNAVGKITISATVESGGKIVEAAAADIFLTNVKTDMSHNYTGKIISVTKNNVAENASNQVLIEKDDGSYVMVSYTPASDVLQIGGETVSEGKFENDLSLGDKLEITGGGSKLTLNLTNQ